MTLQTQATLVKLEIKKWDGYKKDKRVNDDIQARFKTQGKRGNFNKQLFDKDILKPLTKIANSVREEHNKLTTPWCYDGVGVLPNKLFFQYGQMIRSYRDKYEAAADNFESQYPIHIANERTKLEGLFNPDDYPPASEIRKKFAINTLFFPVPDSGHFMLDDLDQNTKQELSIGLDSTLANQQRETVQHLYDRIIKLVGHMHERLSDPQHIFRDSLVQNVQQLVDVLPAMNLFGDPKIDEVVSKLQTEVLIAEPEDLRVDMPLRKHIADQAFDIVNLLNGGEAHANSSPAGSPT